MLEDISWANEMTTKDALRFWSKVDATGDCWLWLAAKDTRGYGQFQYAGRKYRAHRVAYEMLVGSIPDGLTIDHLCQVRACVFPDHMEPVPFAVNHARSKKRHFCLRGHPRTPENIMSSGQCRECVRIITRQRLEQKDMSVMCRKGHLRSEFGWHVSAKGVRQCAECYRIANPSAAERALVRAHGSTGC